MTKRFISVFLALALILTALAGCGSPSTSNPTESPSTNNETTNPPEATNPPAGGQETPAATEPPVEQTPVPTAELPVMTVPPVVETPAPTAPGEGSSSYVELPVGAYAAYDGDDIVMYLKATGRTMVLYLSSYISAEVNCSYDADGNCVMEMDGETMTVQFIYKNGSYYMGAEDEYLLLKPISENDLPVYNDDDDNKPSPFGPDMTFIGGTGSFDLYTKVPESIKDGISFNSYEGFSMMQESDDNENTGSSMILLSIVASGDVLQELVDEAKEDYTGNYSSDADLLYCYLRDNYVVSALGDDFPGDTDEDTLDLNGLTWRYYEIYAEAEGETVDMALLFWMDGSNMALVMIGIDVKASSDYASMSTAMTDFVSSLTIDM